MLAGENAGCPRWARWSGLNIETYSTCVEHKSDTENDKASVVLLYPEMKLQQWSMLSAVLLSSSLIRVREGSGLAGTECLVSQASPAKVPIPNVNLA